MRLMGKSKPTDKSDSVAHFERPSGVGCRSARLTQVVRQVLGEEGKALGADCSPRSCCPELMVIWRELVMRAWRLS